MENKIRKTILKNASLGFSLARVGHYAAQGVWLPLVETIATGSRKEKPKSFQQVLAIILPKIKELLEKDSENISLGLYPIEVLAPENPLKHYLRLPLLFKDAFKASQRKKLNKTKEFGEEANDFKQELPDYYSRNFHFQTGGYLSEVSADLYEHQVEILFSGAADPMRRLLLAPLKRHFNGSDGQGLHFLEIASGTGSMTKFLTLTFPKAKITCLDLSSFYLTRAKKKLKDFRRVDFIQGRAEDMPFKDETFDAVVSCFLFHELPLEVRKSVLQEARRVLKTKGFYGMIDSLQRDDDPDMNWALEQFPKDFHEPFYKNYVQNPLQKLASEAGFDQIQCEFGFLSKVVTAIKS